MDSLKQIKDTAAQWIARRGSEDWSATDQATLEQWLSQSTANRIAYLRLESTWAGANRLKALGAGFAPGSVPSLEDFRSSPFFKHAQLPAEPANEGAARVVTSRSRRRILAIAASVLFAAGLVFAGRAYLSGDTYSTPIGVTANVPLPDGSKVTLNTNSQIRVAVTERERRVSLEQGEAFFDVTRDPKRPFIVRAGDKLITVLGTRFSVRRDEDDVRVAVTEGMVRVDQLHGAGLRGTRIVAGSVARTRDASVAVKNHSVSEVEELLSWRSGYIVLHETSLADAAAEFNRYNARKLVIRDAQVARITVSGNFRATSVDAFAHLLESGFPVSVERDGDRLLLSRR